MPTITNISEQKRRPNRRNVYLDGQFAFGCNVNVIARFRLREGLVLDAASIQQIQLGEVKQGCIDAALRFITSRQHSTSELRRKLARQEWGTEVIEAAVADLTRLNYLDDARFARNKAESSAQHKKQGRSRARLELLRAGVSSGEADQALATVYDAVDAVAMARSIAEKKLPSLRRLPAETARRRLAGLLQRRGFDFDTIRPILDALIHNDFSEASE